jgi:hypothetical protein
MIARPGVGQFGTDMVNPGTTMNDLDQRHDTTSIGSMATALTSAMASFSSLSRAGRPIRLRFAAPRARAGTFALTVTVNAGDDGYHLTAEAEACLDAGDDERSRLGVLDGFTVEARGRDVDTAVDLLLEDVEHYLRPLVDWVVDGDDADAGATRRAV